MRNWLKTLLFLSAFSPALLSLALARYWQNGLSPDVVYYAAAGICGASSTVGVIAAVKKYGEIITFTARKIESSDAMMVSVVGTYFIPFLGKASNITVAEVLCLIVAYAVILWVSSSIVPHPLLRILSFRFYKIEAANGVVFTLITQRELTDPKNVRAVKRISGSMLMEVA